MSEEGKRNKFQMIAAAVVVAAGIIITLFAHWEPSAESWIYWLFSRIFAETGRFIIIDRSPLYTLYLNMFRWMGYPALVTVEYVVTSLIVAISLIIFFKRYTGLFWAAFAVLLWLPFLQSAEPPVQKLALAFSCLAILARDTKVSRFRLAVSYALLGLAYMLRSTYIVFIITFAVWDSVKVFRQKGLKGFLRAVRPRQYDWPILIILILLIWFNLMQSPHKWNNASTFSATWFPANTKTLADSAFIQNHNSMYILRKYGTYVDKDFYFTNQELFKGADTMIGAIRANPRFVIAQTARNIKTAVGLAVNFTLLPHIYKRFSFLGQSYYIIALIFMLSLISFVLYGVFRACKSRDMVLFFIANIFLIGTTIISFPKERYMHPLIPILILGAFWWGEKIRNIFIGLGGSSKIAKRLFTISGHLIIPAFLIFLSNGPLTGATWQTAIGDIVGDIRRNEVSVMERRPYSLKASFKSLQHLIKDCNGILTLENRYLVAFMDIPDDKVYDIWEIPPFGHLGDSSYDGLYPDRIDCVLVSHTLATAIGSATNVQLRYQNYIKPYTEQLKSKGAKVHNIEKYGEAIVLR